MICHAQLLPEQLKKMNALRSAERLSYPEVLMAFEAEIIKQQDDIMKISKRYDEKIEVMQREQAGVKD